MATTPRTPGKRPRGSSRRAYFKRNATFAAFDSDYDATTLFTENEKYEHQLSLRVAAYSTFEVVSSLIFGFSVSVLFSEVITQEFEDELLENIFLNLLCFVLVLSGYSLITVSITHYFVNRFLADYKYGVAMKYLSMYRGHRKYARRSFYISIILLLASLGVFLYDHATHFSAKVISSSILGCGSIFLSYAMYSMLNPNKYLKKRLNSSMSRANLQQKLSMEDSKISESANGAERSDENEHEHENEQASNDDTPPAVVAMTVTNASPAVVKLKRATHTKRMGSSRVSSEHPSLNEVPERSDSEESEEEKANQPAAVTITRETDENENLKAQQTENASQTGLRLSEFQPSPKKKKSIMSRMSTIDYSFNATFRTDNGIL